MPRKLSHDKTTDLQGAIGLNQSSRKICKRFSVGKSTVNRYANKLNPDRQRAKGGRPSIDLGRTGRYLSRDIVSGLYKTAKEVHMHLCDLGFRMSYQSCINQLKRLGFHAAIKKKSRCSPHATDSAALHGPNRMKIGQRMTGAVSFSRMRPKLTFGAPTAASTIGSVQAIE